MGVLKLLRLLATLLLATMSPRGCVPLVRTQGELSKTPDIRFSESFLGGGATGMGLLSCLSVIESLRVRVEGFGMEWVALETAIAPLSLDDVTPVVAR